MSSMGVEFTERELVDFIIARRRSSELPGLTRVVVKFGFEARIDIGKELKSQRENQPDSGDDRLQLLLKYRGDHNSTFKLVEDGCKLEGMLVEDQSVVENHWEGIPESW
jgi:hypothetical protein